MVSFSLLGSEGAMNWWGWGRVAIRFRIGVKAAPALGAELTVRHHLAQQRTAAKLRVAEGVIQHVERAHDGIESDEVGGFERAHLVAEAFLENGVHLGSRGDAVLQHANRLVHEEMGNAIRDEAGRVSHSKRLFFYLGEKYIHCRER